MPEITVEELLQAKAEELRDWGEFHCKAGALFFFAAAASARGDTVACMEVLQALAGMGEAQAQVDRGPTQPAGEA